MAISRARAEAVADPDLEEPHAAVDVVVAGLGQVDRLPGGRPPGGRLDDLAAELVVEAEQRRDGEAMAEVVGCGRRGGALERQPGGLAPHHVDALAGPQVRQDARLGGVEQAARVLGALRAAEGDHPRRRVPAGDGHGGEALRGDHRRGAGRRGDGAGERAIDRRFAGRLGPDGGAVGVRHRDDVADPYLVEPLNRDRDVRDHQVALVGPHGQHALEMIDGGDGAPQGDLFEHDVARLGGGQCGRQDEAGNRGDGRRVLRHSNHSRSSAGRRRRDGAVVRRWHRG